MKKKVQKNINTEKAYGFSEVMSMLENMNDGIQIIAEQQVDMKNDIDVIKDGMVEVKDRLTNVEDNVIEIKHKLSEKVDRDEFNKLEKRMIKLEKLVLAKIA